MSEGEEGCVGVGFFLVEKIGEVDGVVGVVAGADHPFLAGGEGEVVRARELRPVTSRKNKGGNGRRENVIRRKIQVRDQHHISVTTIEGRISI